MPKQNKQIKIKRGKLCEDDNIISRLAALPPKRLKLFLSAFVFFVIALSICGFYIISKQATSHQSTLGYILTQTFRGMRYNAIV